MFVNYLVISVVYGDLFWGIFSVEETILVAAAELFIIIDWQIAPQNQTL